MKIILENCISKRDIENTRVSHTVIFSIKGDNNKYQGNFTQFDNDLQPLKAIIKEAICRYGIDHFLYSI